MQASNKHIQGFIVAIILMLVITGCSLDDKYHYTLSYRINNQTENSQSGFLIRDSIYYLNPSIGFEVEAGKALELFTEDGGDGPNVTPPFGYSLSTKEIHINTDDQPLIIDVESDEKWEYTTDGSTGIYTFLITEDLIGR